MWICVDREENPAARMARNVVAGFQQQLANLDVSVPLPNGKGHRVTPSAKPFGGGVVG
jgi:hypothetical protein